MGYHERVLHCWHGPKDDAEIGSEEWVAAELNYPDGAVCLLEAGHAGPHEYTPNDQVEITFRLA